MARPSALTGEVRERIETQLADGIPVVVIAQKVGGLDIFASRAEGRGTDT